MAPDLVGLFGESGIKRRALPSIVQDGADMRQRRMVILAHKSGVPPARSNGGFRLPLSFSVTAFNAPALSLRSIFAFFDVDFGATVMP